MTEVSPALAKSLLDNLPLFAGFEPAQLERLLSVFERKTLKDGESVFEAGSVPQGLTLLVEGSLSVRDEDGEVFEVHPFAPVGELGVFTGEARNLDVIVADSATLLTAPTEPLEAFLRENGDIAFELQRSLLRLAARKIGRDRRRLSEMRDNIVSTQKTMKRMREALLEGEDNPLHAALFEELDSLIEQNRKIHYLVEPSRLVPTAVRLADGSECKVGALSTEWLYFSNPPASLKPGTDITFTLLLDGGELPASGRLERADPSEGVVYLDNLIPDYESKLNQHLARAQLLDVVL